MRSVGDVDEVTTDLVHLQFCSVLGPDLVRHHADLKEYLHGWLSKQDLIIESLFSSHAQGIQPQGQSSPNISIHSSPRVACEMVELGEFPAIYGGVRQRTSPMQGSGAVRVEKGQQIEQGGPPPQAQPRRKSVGSNSTGSRDRMMSPSSGQASQDRWRMDDNEHIQMAKKHTVRDLDGSELQGDPGSGKTGFMQRLLNDARFEAACAFMIIANSIFVGVQVQYSASERTNTQSRHLQIGHVVFCVLFSAELGMRITDEFPVFFLRRNGDWLLNWFDVLVVAASIFEAFADWTGAFDNLTWLLFVRIARSLRLVRFIRRGAFFRELRAMVYMIAHTLKALVWSLVLLFMLMYMFSLVLTQGVTNFLIAHDPLGELAVSVRVQKFFGSIHLSMLTLLHSLTGGISWSEPAELLRAVDTKYPLYEVVFASFILFTLFAMLNVITGFFCENAREKASSDREHMIQEQMSDRKRYLKEVKALFCEIDADGDNMLSLDELEQTMKNASVKAYLSSMQIDVSQVWDIFKLLDDDGSGTINVEEFADGCLRLRGQAKSLDIAFLKFEVLKLQKKMQSFMSFVDAQFGQVAVDEKRLVQADLSPETTERN